MTTTVCVQCGSNRVHRSRRRHPLERIVTLLGCGLRRCHNCNSRFVRFGGSLLRITDLRRVSRRLALAIAMLVAATLIIGTILWFSHTQSNPTIDTQRLPPVELAGRA